MTTNYIRNPFAKHLKENGYRVQVTTGEDERIIEEYFVTPEEVEDRNRWREVFLKNNLIRERS